MILPPHLKPGDTIGIISPSWGAPAAFPHRLEAGIRQIEALGFHVQVGRHARGQRGHVSGTGVERAADLNAFIANPAVRAIISSLGGDHACQMLPHLDWDRIRANPKVIMGFSDMSVLNIAIYAMTGLVTFNGSHVMTDFAEYPAMFDYARELFIKTVMRAEPVGQVEPAKAWTEELLDWEHQQDQQRPRQMEPSPGWTWLKPGNGEGRLLGGCIESLQHLRGTRYWPDWQDTIFFWETSEDKPTPETIDGILMDYENMGVLEQIRGMLVGRPMRYSQDEKQQLNAVIVERTHRYDFPIITGMDFGHTSPQMVLPVGVLARIDSQHKAFSIIGPAVM